MEPFLVIYNLHINSSASFKNREVSESLHLLTSRFLKVTGKTVKIELIIDFVKLFELKIQNTCGSRFSGLGEDEGGTVALDEIPGLRPRPSFEGWRALVGNAAEDIILICKVRIFMSSRFYLRIKKTTLSIA